MGDRSTLEKPCGVVQGEVVNGVIKTISGDTPHQPGHTCSHHSTANLQQHMVNLALLRARHHFTMQHNRLALVAVTRALDHTNHRLPMGLCAKICRHT